MTGIPS